MLFEDIAVHPLHVTKSYMTVMAPLTSAGSYSVRIEHERQRGAAQGFLVSEMPAVPSDHRSQSPFKTSKTWRRARINGPQGTWELFRGDVGVGFPPPCARASMDLRRVLSALDAELQSMDPEALQAMNQLLVTSGIFEQVQTAKYALRYRAEDAVAPHQIPRIAPSGEEWWGFADAVLFRGLVRLDAVSGRVRRCQRCHQCDRRWAE